MVKAVVLLVLLLATAGAAEPLRVGAAGEAPFVEWTGAGQPTGAAVELWEKIAAANEWTFAYEKFASTDDGLAAVAKNNIDVLVGDTGITRARLASVDFSQPFFRSGLQIMISEAMVFWIILGLITVAYVTSSITSSMTVDKLTAGITGPQDLPGKTVAAIEGSAGADYLLQKGITTLTKPDLKTAVASMLAHDAAAAIDDAPVLQLYDFQHPELPITEAGPIFAPQNYGFAFAFGSLLRMPVNASLLELVESKSLEALMKRYLGPVHLP